jgi:cytochrome b
MSQATLRRWHRRIGVALALFILLQAGTGLLLEWENFFRPEPALQGHVHEEEEETDIPATIHHGSFFPATKTAVSIYRLLLAAGLIWMALSGGVIFLRMPSRAKGPRPRK